MLIPKRAPVRPRVLTPVSGEAMPLDEELRPLIESGTVGAVQLAGPPGSGKTTALEDAAAVFGDDPRVLFLDEPDSVALANAPTDRLIVYTTRKPWRGGNVASYRLAPWGEDELIEYLLAAHRDSCAAVLSRVRQSDHALLGGLPDLWRIVLDRLAYDPSLPDVRSALHRHVEAQLPDTDLVQRARSACLNALAGDGINGQRAVQQLGAAGFLPGMVRVLRHSEIQRLLATERIAADLRDGGDCDYLALRLPRSLLRAAAAEVARDERALERLREFVAGPPWAHAMAASLLHLTGSGWKPEPGQVPCLAGAYLKRAAWRGVKLPGADLREADLRSADLRGASLDGADAWPVNLQRARLRAASLNGFIAAAANLSHADLTAVRGEKACFAEAHLEGANLEGASLKEASFVDADLTGAVFAGALLLGALFHGARIQGADFSGADLRLAGLSQLALREATFFGACFRGANLRGCDLEGMDLPGMDFRDAQLEDSLLTGAVMTGSDFTGACLCRACLGEVDWEGACLRDADLSGATFHMGSSRSGLLFTPIASEGTRTGFYTDEDDEQHFKAPEEIRKANLRGADLRGACVAGVDFYLVDLRDARYDADQEQHFRRCRAILEPAD